MSDDDKKAASDDMAGNAVLGRTSIRNAIDSLSGTPAWGRCSKRTLRRLERFLGSERVPDGTDADAFALYTAQGYLNGSVASVVASCESGGGDALPRRDREYLGIARVPEPRDAIAASNQRQIDAGFRRGFTDGMSAIASYHHARGRKGSAVEQSRMVSLSIVSALMGMARGDGLRLRTMDDVIGAVHGDGDRSYSADCVLLVSECVAGVDGVTPLVSGVDRYGAGSATAAHIGVPTRALRESVTATVPALHGYVVDRVSPAMSVCSDGFTLPAENATMHAYGMLSALLRPAEGDDDAPLVADVMDDAEQDAMAGYAMRIGDGAIGPDSTYDVLSDLALALDGIGVSLVGGTYEDEYVGRSVLGGIVDAYRTRDDR